MCKNVQVVTMSQTEFELANRILSYLYILTTVFSDQIDQIDYKEKNNHFKLENVFFSVFFQ